MEADLVHVQEKEMVKVTPDIGTGLAAVPEIDTSHGDVQEVIHRMVMVYNLLSYSITVLWNEKYVQEIFPRTNLKTFDPAQQTEDLGWKVKANFRRSFLTLEELNERRSAPQELHQHGRHRQLTLFGSWMFCIKISRHKYLNHCRPDSLADIFGDGKKGKKKKQKEVTESDQDSSEPEKKKKKKSKKKTDKKKKVQFFNCWLLFPVT